MYRNALAACSFYLAATLLSGCANQQNVGSISQTQETTPFQIQEAMAVLYLFNDSGWTLLSGNQDVTDNGKTIVSLPRQTYTRIIITPGPHLLRPDPFLWKQEVSLRAEPGANYYIVIGYKPERSWSYPLMGAPLLMKQLSEEEATLLIKEMKLR